MPRNQTPEQKAAWAEYMREYRKRRSEGRIDPRGTVPTSRQIEILRAYADPVNGGSQERVAAQFGITTSAVNAALQRLMKRLGVHDPAQAVCKIFVEKENDTDGTTPQVPR